MYAPSGAKIIGLRLEDGSVCPFQYTFDADTQTSQYILDRAGQSKVPSPVALVDDTGRDWASGDVEYHTLFQRPR